MTHPMPHETTPATVCMTHYRFVPCRRCVEPNPAVWSSDPEDVRLVQNYRHRFEA